MEGDLQPQSRSVQQAIRDALISFPGSRSGLLDALSAIIAAVPRVSTEFLWVWTVLLVRETLTVPPE